MLNPNFIIFIQLSHYCLTSEIIFVSVYGCELFTIPDLICTVTLLTTYCSRNHVKTIYRSCKLSISRIIFITDISHDLIEFSSLTWTKTNSMCRFCSKWYRLRERLMKIMYFRQRDSYTHRWYTAANYLAPMVNFTI